MWGIGCPPIRRACLRAGEAAAQARTSVPRTANTGPPGPGSAAGDAGVSVAGLSVGARPPAGRLQPRRDRRRGGGRSWRPTGRGAAAPQLSMGLEAALAAAGRSVRAAPSAGRGRRIGGEDGRALTVWCHGVRDGRRDASHDDPSSCGLPHMHGCMTRVVHHGMAPILSAMARQGHRHVCAWPGPCRGRTLSRSAHAVFSTSAVRHRFSV